MGRVEVSAKILAQGAAVWPFSLEIQKALVLRCVTLKQFPQAREALKQYVIQGGVKHAGSKKHRRAGGPSPILQDRGHILHSFDRW
jgi:hypothetical protein